MRTPVTLLTIMAFLLGTVPSAVSADAEAEAKRPFSEDAYAGVDPYAPAEEERNFIPWMVGGLVVGGGIAGAIVVAQDDDGGSSGSSTPPADDDADDDDSECSEDDVLGTWEGTVHTITATHELTVEVLPGGALEVTDEVSGPAIDETYTGGGTWNLDDCTFRMAFGGGDIVVVNGSGELSEDKDQVEIGGTVFTK